MREFQVKSCRLGAFAPRVTAADASDALADFELKAKYCRMRISPGVPAPDLVERYGYDPATLTGADHALYERHLLFDDAIDPATATPRQRFEAFARSVRDILSQRWVRTERTYERENAKRIYYLSMEYLIGRSLANNVTNLLLAPLVGQACSEMGLDWPALLEEEPDAGLGNGGLGRLAACFLESMATRQLPAMGYGLCYEYGIFKQTIRDGWQFEQPDNWLRRPDPWGVMRPRKPSKCGWPARSSCGQAS
jgi:starch phosphorylase